MVLVDLLWNIVYKFCGLYFNYIQELLAIRPSHQKEQFIIYISRFLFLAAKKGGALWKTKRILSKRMRMAIQMDIYGFFSITK